MSIAAVENAGRALAERLGLNVLGTEGHDLKVPCVCCKSSDAGRVHQESGVFNCYACGKALNAFDLCKVVLHDHKAAIDAMVAVGLFEPAPVHKGNGHSSTGPTQADEDGFFEVCRLKRMPPKAVKAYGGEPWRGGVRIPMWGTDLEVCSHIHITPENGKGFYSKGKPTGLFLPGRSPEPGESWLVVEGAKDAAALHELGHLAAGLPGNRMKKEFAPLFQNCEVVVVADGDKAGQEGATVTAGLLLPHAKSVKKTTCPDGKDIRDVLALDGVEGVGRILLNAQEATSSGEELGRRRRNKKPRENLIESFGKGLRGIPSLDTDPGRTQLANAKRLAGMHGDQMRWCGPFGSWLTYDGMRWEIDRRHLAERYAKEVSYKLWEEIASHAEDAEDPEELAPLIRFAKASGDARAIDACLKLARSEPGIAVLPDDLDSDPWLLNVLNGTINLQTGQLQPHRKGDLLTKLCHVTFDPNATAPLWESVLARALNNTPDLITFVKRLFGYSLTGVVREQILPVFYGTGANGKSVLLGGFMDVLGPNYSMKAPQGLLCVKKGESHPTELADLFGRRFVAAIETNEGSRLDEALVKELTGNDRIRARFMRQDFFEFAPTHKVLMACNHKPVVRGTDHAIWRRLRIVPFTVTIPDEEQDKDLPSKLREEATGILAWAVRGCLEWQTEGLTAPPDILVATERYRVEQDTVGEFLETCCVVADSAWAKASSLLEAYQEFSGDRSMSAKKLGGILRDRGFQDDRTRTARMWRGIGLLSDGWKV